MTYAPKTISDLARYWTSQGGVNLGIVGNAAHTIGYHLGKDRIYDGSGPGIGASDYSVRLARDKAGLTNAASALDLGKLDGKYTELRRFSRWLVNAAMHNRTKYRDVREIIYSPDGMRVQRWSGEDNLIHTGPGNGDNSHLSHTHISFYRDSEARAKVQLFTAYFAPAVTEDDMPPITTYIPGQVATVKPTANVRVAPDVNAKILRTLTSPEQWVVTGWVTGGVDAETNSNQWVTRWNNGWEYTAKGNLSAGPAVPPDASPYTKAQLDAAVKAEHDKQEARITGIKQKVAAANTDVADD